MQRKILKTLLLLLILILILPFSSSNSYATLDGSYSIQVPNSGNLVEQCSYSADILIDTGSNNSNAGDIIISYDPSKIQIIDSNNDISGVQIQTGNAYSAYGGNIVNESKGEIKLTGFSFDAPLNGSGIFGSIEFKSKPNISSAGFQIEFDGANENNTTDSNIAIAETSFDALGTVNNANFTFEEGYCGNDTTKPEVNFINPKNNQKGVPLDENVTIKIADDLSGVNFSSLEININGEIYKFNDTEVEITGSANNYSITINPRENFFANSPSAILVLVEDNAGNQRKSSISFNHPTPPPIIIPPEVVDETSPVLSIDSPLTGETFTEGSIIQVTIQDDNEIDIDSIKIYLNDTVYTNADEAFTYEILDNGSVRVTIIENFSLPEGNSSYIFSVASDVYGNTGTTSTLFNTPTPPQQEIKPDECNCETDDTSNQDDSGSGTDVSSDKSFLKIDSNEIPFDSTINSVEESIANFFDRILPDSLSKIIDDTLEEAGLLGVVGLGFVLGPILLWLIGALTSFLAGTLPFFIVGKMEKRRNTSTVIDSSTKKPVSFALIKVFSKEKKSHIKKIYSGFNGKFYLKIEPGTYTISISKGGYQETSFDFTKQQNEKITKEFELQRKDRSNAMEEYQTQVMKFEPKLFIIAMGILFCFINLIYTRTLLSILILGAMMVIGSVYFFKWKQKRGLKV